MWDLAASGGEGTCCGSVHMSFCSYVVMLIIVCFFFYILQVTGSIPRSTVFYINGLNGLKIPVQLPVQTCRRLYGIIKANQVFI